MTAKLTKKNIARDAGISRSMLYYQYRQDKKDWDLKVKIEETLSQRECHSYGHKRLANHLKINKKRVLRVMKLFGIKPYRRRGRKFKKTSKNQGNIYPNLLLTNMPQHQNQIWVSDFTFIPFHGKYIYLATVMDIFTREIAGWSAMTSHNAQLIINALTSALTYRAKPEIIHSDQGSEYKSKSYISLIENVGIRISMSRKGSPWENGYQESFYNQFKIDLGDANRFENLGELIAGIHEAMYIYNNDRIHSKLKMPPRQYAILKSLNQAVPVL